MNITEFFNVMSCILLDIYRLYEGTRCLLYREDVSAMRHKVV
jgi:hypothetical protein